MVVLIIIRRKIKSKKKTNTEENVNMRTGGLMETGAVDIDEEVVCSIKFRSETVLEDTDSGCSTSTLDTIASQEGTTQSGMHQSKYVYVHVFD